MQEESMKFNTHLPIGWVEVGNTLRDEGIEYSKIYVVLNDKVLFINKTI